MRDFLLFNTFITPTILIFFYYFGAVVIPIMLYLLKDSVIKKISFLQSAQDMIGSFYSSLSLRKQLLTLLIFLLLFLFMELFWRMIFEMMIGYFDMHDYLYQIAKNSV